MARRYELVIKVEEEEVWRGKDSKDKYWEFKKKNIGKRVSISIVCDPDRNLIIPSFDL